MASGARWGPHRPVRTYHPPSGTSQGRSLIQRPRVGMQHPSRQSPRTSAPLPPDRLHPLARQPDCLAMCRSRPLHDNVHHRTMPRAPRSQNVSSSLLLAEQMRTALKTALPVIWVRHAQDTPIMPHTKAHSQRYHRCQPRTHKTAKKTRIYGGRWTTRSRVRPDSNPNRKGGTS